MDEGGAQCRMLSRCSDKYLWSSLEQAHDIGENERVHRSLNMESSLPPAQTPLTHQPSLGDADERGPVLPPDELRILQERLKTIDEAISADELLERVNHALTEEDA